MELEQQQNVVVAGNSMGDENREGLPATTVLPNEILSSCQTNTLTPSVENVDQKDDDCKKSTAAAAAVKRKGMPTRSSSRKGKRPSEAIKQQQLKSFDVIVAENSPKNQRYYDTNWKGNRRFHQIVEWHVHRSISDGQQHRYGQQLVTNESPIVQAIYQSVVSSPVSKMTRSKSVVDTTCDSSVQFVQDSQGADSSSDATQRWIALDIMATTSYIAETVTRVLDQQRENGQADKVPHSKIASTPSQLNIPQTTKGSCSSPDEHGTKSKSRSSRIITPEKRKSANLSILNTKDESKPIKPSNASQSKSSHKSRPHGIHPFDIIIGNTHQEQMYYDAEWKGNRRLYQMIDWQLQYQKQDGSCSSQMIESIYQSIVPNPGCDPISIESKRNQQDVIALRFVKAHVEESKSDKKVGDGKSKGQSNGTHSTTRWEPVDSTTAKGMITRTIKQIEMAAKHARAEQNVRTIQSGSASKIARIETEVHPIHTPRRTRHNNSDRLPTKHALGHQGTTLRPKDCSQQPYHAGGKEGRWSRNEFQNHQPVPAFGNSLQSVPIAKNSPANASSTQQGELRSRSNVAESLYLDFAPPHTPLGKPRKRQDTKLGCAKVWVVCDENNGDHSPKKRRKFSLNRKRVPLPTRRSESTEPGPARKDSPKVSFQLNHEEV